jgi:hypothetical protein
VEDDVYSVDDTATGVGIAHVADDEVDAVCHVRDVCALPGRQIVDHAYVVPEPDELIGEMRANEPRAARDQACAMTA